MKQKVSLARHLYSKGFEKQKIEGIFTFIENYVRFEKPEYNRIVKQQIDGITNKPNTMDIIEQVAEIRAQEVLEKSVSAFLANTEFSVEKIAELTGAPLAFVEKIKKATKSR